MFGSSTAKLRGEFDAIMALAVLSESKTVEVAKLLAAGQDLTDTDTLHAIFNFRGIEIFGINTDKLDSHYFKESRWIFEYINSKNIQFLATGKYMVFNDQMQLIGMISVVFRSACGLSIEAHGEIGFIEDVCKLIMENITFTQPDALGETVETVELIGFDRDGDGQWNRKTVLNPNPIKSEYYPFIEGGVENLLANFLAAEDNCMIWHGVPGTGKTSAIRAGAITHHFMPVMAIKADVVKDTRFLREIFRFSDQAAQESITQITHGLEFDITEFERNTIDAPFFLELMYKRRNQNKQEKHRKLQPVILIEDAELLLTPRASGNVIMSQLLNEIDGIGSEHARKIIFTTNQRHMTDVDEALIRPGRCYGTFEFQQLSPQEAIVARKAAGLPDFEVTPDKPMSLAYALQKPRQRYIVAKNNVNRPGFGS